ncbi:hypothetical protein [Hyphomonas sp.]|uniref:hypothetical protein n=1 Tax=Hyphomonas sp. TaxID=87 RepID=UPI0035272E80
MLNPRAVLGALAGAIAFAGLAQAAPECQSDWLNTAVPVQGLVFGTNEFDAEIADGLVFTLQPDEGGWHTEMRDAEGNNIPTRPVARGIPPVRGQNHLTDSFVFGPDIMDPARNPELVVPGRSGNIAAVEPTPGKQGNGQITILNQAFEKSEAGRMVYMEFEGCVRWNDGPREPTVSHYPSPEDLVNFPGWVVTAFEDCGLPQSLLLSGRMPRPGYRQRAWLEPDMDGDGRPDLVALVEQPEDGQHGMAICLQAGKALTLLGFGPETDDAPLSSDFLADADWWAGEGRTVVIGYEGAGSQQVFMDEDGNLTSKWYGD